MPFKESHKTDSQISFYAATKKSCEILSHSYSHMYNLPITNFRFLLSMGLGADQIWHYLNLLKGFTSKLQLIFSIKEI